MRAGLDGQIDYGPFQFCKNCLETFLEGKIVRICTAVTNFHVHCLARHYNTGNIFERAGVFPVKFGMELVK